MIRAVLASALLIAGTAAEAREPAGLHDTLDRLTREGKFSGAVVVRGAEGVRFSRGYGMADPFTGRAFTPDTPADSGSLAKPVTAAAILMLAREGKIDLDSPATRYLPEVGFPDITIRHLLSHSAGLQLDETAEGLANKSNIQMVETARGKPLLFKPGIAFTYCNLCTIALAEIVERVSGLSYLEFARRRLQLPAAVSLRPARLADWKGRAIGYRRTASGALERADSYEGEAFYGAANLSISAAQMAEWGSRWWRAPLAETRSMATATALIDGNASGLTLGNWYCAEQGRRCHYLGHHQGFHHMLYWDADRRLSVAMVSNNSLAPALQQRLQRAIVAFAEGTGVEARRELAAPLAARPVEPGTYAMPFGETKAIQNGDRLSVIRAGLAYPAYPIGSGIRYVPGLDVYLAGGAGGRLYWLGLYEDHIGRRR